MNNPLKLQAMKRVSEEFKELSKKPLSNFGITVGLIKEDNIFEWRCTLLGPKDSVYRGGLFFLKIIFPENYPNNRPEIICTTPIYHLNINFRKCLIPLGHVCLNTINKWKKDFTINKALSEVFYLLSHNNPNSAFDYPNFSRRNEYLNNRALFDKKAKFFTKKYANPQIAQNEFTTEWDFTYPQ